MQIQWWLRHKQIHIPQKSDDHGWYSHFNMIFPNKFCMDNQVKPVCISPASIHHELWTLLII